MREIRPDYEFPVEGRAWTHGGLPEAGVFFLQGDCHIVARNGPAALALEERGALLVALVRFDGRSREDASPGHAVRPLGLDEAVARFAAAPRGELQAARGPGSGAPPAGDRMGGAPRS